MPEQHPPHCVSMLREMSRAVTLCVRAPHEMNCTPVSAITLRPGAQVERRAQQSGQLEGDRMLMGRCYGMRSSAAGWSA